MSIDKSVSKLLTDEMLWLKQDIVRNMEQAGKTVTGRTKNSLQVFASGKQAVLEGASHLHTLESGRGPARGGAGDKQQFIQNLKEWIVAKGISYKDEQDLQRLASFFRWYINKFGISLYRRGGRKDIFTPAIEKFTKSVNAKIAKVYASELVRIIT